MLHNLYTTAAGFVCSRLKPPEWEPERDAIDVWASWCMNFELVKYRKTPSLVIKVKNSMVTTFGLELQNNYCARGVCGNFFRWARGSLHNVLSKHILTHAAQILAVGLLSGEGWTHGRHHVCAVYFAPSCLKSPRFPETCKCYARLAISTHFHPTQ